MHPTIISGHYLAPLMSKAITGCRLKHQPSLPRLSRACSHCWTWNREGKLPTGKTVCNPLILYCDHTRTFIRPFTSGHNQVRTSHPTKHLSAACLPNNLLGISNTHPSYDHHGGGGSSWTPLSNPLSSFSPSPCPRPPPPPSLAPPSSSQLTPSSPTALPHLPAVKHLKEET